MSQKMKLLSDLENPVLRTPARPLAYISPELASVTEEMIELMDQSDGVGLAAPQVGLGLRFFVYRWGGPAEVVINPQITWTSQGTRATNEGCLSLPGTYVSMHRARNVNVTHQDLDGNEVYLEADGMLARILQHEIDHLNGILIDSR